MDRVVFNSGHFLMIRVYDDIIHTDYPVLFPRPERLLPAFASQALSLLYSVEALKQLHDLFREQLRIAGVARTDVVVLLVLNDKPG